MVLLKRLRQFTIVYVPDPERPVKRFRLPRAVLFAAPALAAAAVIAVPFWFTHSRLNADFVALQLTSQFQLEAATWSEEKQRLEKDVSSKAQTIEQLQSSVLRLSEAADDMQRKLDELKALEDRVRSMSKLSKTDTPPVSETSSSLRGRVELFSSSAGGSQQLLSEGDSKPLIGSAEDAFQALSGQLDSVKTSLSALQAELEQRRKKERATPTIWPSDSRQITSGFGYRLDPFNGKPSFHTGFDLQGSIGDGVYATADGVVDSAGWSSDYGYNIWVRHGYGIRTHYGHLSRILVSEGKKVAKGDKIGLVGSTGRSTGPHLHYEVEQNGKVINPKPYLLFDRKEIDKE